MGAQPRPAVDLRLHEVIGRPLMVHPIGISCFQSHLGRYWEYGSNWPKLIEQDKHQGSPW